MDGATRAIFCSSTFRNLLRHVLALLKSVNDDTQIFHVLLPELLDNVVVKIEPFWLESFFVVGQFCYPTFDVLDALCFRRMQGFAYHPLTPSTTAL